jgi:NitT/TauT family transport system substrate-binding protein
MSQGHGTRAKGRLSRRKFLGAAVGTPLASRLFVRPASAAGETVRVGFPLSDHYAPVYVAKEKGFFADAGLQIEFKNFVTGGPVVEGLASQSMDIGFLGTPGVIAVARKFPLTSVMGIALEGSGIVVKRSGIESIHALVGKSVGLPARGSIAHLLLLRALTNANIDPDRIRIVEIGDLEGLRLGLLRGEIDAAAIWEPWVSQYEQSSELRRLALSHDIWPHHQCDFMWVGTAFLKQHPDAVKAVIDAVLKGMLEIQKNFDGSAKVLSTALKMPAEIEPLSMHRQEFTHVLQKENLGDQYALLRQVGIVKADDVPPWERLVDTEMYAYANQRWNSLKRG